MKKKPASKSAFFNQRVLIGFSFCLLGLVLALLAFAAIPGGNAFAKQEKATVPAVVGQNANATESSTKTAELAMVEDGPNFDGVAPSAPAPAQPDVIGATFVVNTINDTADVSPGDGVCLDSAGACSLRAAISEANALAGADTITIGPVVYTTTLVAANEDANAGGDYDIRSDITINGVSAATSILQANAAPNTATEKVLHITTGAGVVNINNVTIRNGNSTVNTLGGGVRIDAATNVVTFTNCVISGNRVTNPVNAFAGGLGITAGSVTLTGTTVSGNSSVSTGAAAANNGFAGGIYNQQATVNLVNSIVTGNFATSFHGGIRNLSQTLPSTMTITNSTISNNQAQGQNTAGGAGEGGGLANFGVANTANATVTITGSTFSGNAAQVLGAPGTGTVAGGIENFSSAGTTGPAVINLTNSTISGNNAASGGGMWNEGPVSTMNIKFSTVASNSATTGGGLFQTATVGGITNLKDSVVADNTATTGSDISGVITSQGFNHLESTAGGTFAATGGDVVTGDPALGALANNGGPTFTHLPGGASVVLNTIPNGTNECGSIAVDQRALVRPSGAGCDKGSVEVQGGASPTPSPSVTPVVPTPTPSASASPGTPTPSPSGSPCSGGTTTFTNSTAITLTDCPVGCAAPQPASLYPSNITVSGVSGTVSKVTVTISGWNHTFPGDNDMLLVGPGGQKFIVLSDALTTADTTGQTYTFDDTAAALMASAPATAPASGSFKPTNYTTGDTFPAPAPAAPYLSPATAGTDLLAAFNGVNPNGVWSLYIVDDANIDSGTLTGGWSLSITTGGGACGTPTPSPTASASATPCGGAPVTLYDQSDSAGTASTVSQNFEAALDANDAQTADDFVVPAGQTWTIQQVAVTAVYFNGPGPAVSFNVFVYNNAAGNLPGTVVAGGSQLNATYTNVGGLFTVTLPSSVVLTAGTYWVAVQANMDFGAPTAGEWGWTNRTVMSNQGAAWINPGGAFATPCGTAWGRRTTCIAGDASPDQLFRLIGTNGAGGCPTPTPSASVSPGVPTPTPSASGTPCSGANLVADGGFEAGSPWAAWTTQTSTNFGSSICDTTLCNVNGGLTAPRTGINWNWFGGGTGGAVEDSTTGQSFTIPAGATSLHFWMNIQTVVTPFTDTVQVKVDGTTVQTFTEPAVAEGAYTERVIDLTSFANGASHSLVFVYHSTDGASNFLIDDISVTGSCASPSPGVPTPTPSASASASPSPTCAGAWAAGPTVPPVAMVRAPGNLFTDGKFYVIGGRSADVAGADFTNPFVYDPGTNAWTMKPSVIPDGLVNNMACGVLTVGGTPQIYCVGGSQSQVVGTASRVFSYNPATDTFTTLAAGDNWPGSQAGTFLPGGFAVNGNKLYIIGSFNANAVPPVMTAQVWQFDPTAAVGSKWVARADFPQQRGYVPAASIGGFIYTGGGSALDPTGALIDSVESFKYEVATNTWTAIANIPRSTGETRAVVMNGKMWVLGGGRTAPNPSNEVDIFDPGAGTWSTGQPFSLGRRNFAADSNGTDRIFIAGGYDSGGLLSNAMEIFATGSCPSPSPTIAPSATPTIAPSATPTIGPSATPTIGPSASPSASAPVSTPTPSPGVRAQAVNFSTRVKVLVGGSREGIGGFIVTGSGPKNVIIRALGPSLTRFGITDAMADPTLELHGPAGFTTVLNNDWRSTQQAAIEATGLPPTNNLESAIVATLNPGQYTAVVKGNGNTEGVVLIEVYDLNPGSGSQLGNISTRAFVSTGDDIIIAGFILGNGGADDSVVVRGMGPSLAALGVQNVLANPTLELRDNNGALLIANNDWQDNAAQKALIQAAGLAPSNNLESAVFATLPPGLYTALLAGLNKTTGNALVEVYDLGAAPTVPGPSATPIVSPTPGGPSPTPGGPSPTPPASSPTPPAATPTPSPAGNCTESFDGVAAPALPAGWVNTVVVGDAPGWITSTTSPDSGANDLFVIDQNGVSDKTVDSRDITVSSAAAELSFRNFFQTEYDPPVPGPEHFWDGYVLEVSVNGGAFGDLVGDAGGVFVTGGYIGEIDGTAGNPLAGRPAWCGTSGGVVGAPVYIDTKITLPASMNGQSIKLRFRMGTDEAQEAPGVRVDSLTITGASCP